MKDLQDHQSIKQELGQLLAEFFESVSFKPGEFPAYKNLHSFFIEQGLLIKNISGTPEITNIDQFIEPREAMVNAGVLIEFLEVELSEVTEIFGNVAHRFSGYAKSGVMNNAPFEVQGMITTQFVHTPTGWRISSMAWDDERPGLSISEGNIPKRQSHE